MFLPKALLDKMVRYGLELYDQIDDNAAYWRASIRGHSAGVLCAERAGHPFFIQADFGLVEEAGRDAGTQAGGDPGLPVDLCFPGGDGPRVSTHVRAWMNCGLSPRKLFGRPYRGSFRDRMADAVLGGHAPEEVVLLEIDPFGQKTLVDFLATRRLLGLQIVDVMKVEKRGQQIVLQRCAIKRIYNRVIVDELVSKHLSRRFALPTIWTWNGPGIRTGFSG